MSFKGVTVNQLDGGLGRRTPSPDGTALLIIGSAVAATGLAVNTAEKLLALPNAEAKGITASYDSTNTILAHYHIDEFFRINPNGTLYVVLADGTFTDENLKTIIKDNDDIRAVGVVRNSADAVVDFSAYIGGYQTVVNELKTEHVLVDSIVLEGNEFTPEDTVADFADLREEDAPNISVCAVQDPVITALNAAYAKHAAIGSVLGALTVRQVNEELGSVNIINKPSYAKGTTTFPLTDTGRSRWLSSVLQNGIDVNSLLETEKQALQDKGYIFAGSYTGLAGVYFSSGPTLSEIASDYAFIDSNRIFNKASRGIRLALLPRVKSNILVDPASGFIRPTEAADLEQLAKRPLLTMEADQEISGSAVYINPEQEVNDQSPLQVTAQIVKNGIVYEIEVDLGFTKSIS